MTSRFPQGFFERIDRTDDRYFYGPPRLVTHIDDAAINEVGLLYDELGVDGTVLDLMSSWVSHFHRSPDHLTVLGMNRDELDANAAAAEVVVHDLNADPTLPFVDDNFDDVVCCVSIDYLIRPIQVFADVARVLRPGGRFVTTFSNRVFPTKAIRGWLDADEAARVRTAVEYFRRSGGFEEPTAEMRNPDRPPGADPLYAVWARVRR